MKPPILPLSALLIIAAMHSATAAVITCDSAKPDSPLGMSGVAPTHQFDPLPIKSRSIDLLNNGTATKSGLWHLSGQSNGVHTCKSRNCGPTVLDRYNRWFGDNSRPGVIPPKGGHKPQLPPNVEPKPDKGGNVVDLPEPSTWGLTLAGLVLASFARRRSLPRH